MTNDEFNFLMQLTKKFKDQCPIFPQSGKNGIYMVNSTTTDDRFFLDIDRRSSAELAKIKIQNRYVTTRLPLVRIEIDCPPHTNPDGTTTSRNHIHIFRESDAETGNLLWAYELDSINCFKDIPIDFMSVLLAFCEYCNIITCDIQGVINNEQF